MDDVKMSEISEVSSSKLGECSYTRIQELLQKYGTESRKAKAEDSSISAKASLHSIKESRPFEPVLSASLSTSLHSCSTSSSTTGSISVLPASFTPAPAPSILPISSRPPLSYSARITPRPRRTNSVSSPKIKYYEKGVQVNIMQKGVNDENTPPDTHAAYTTLKKQAQEMEARLKKANEILANENAAYKETEARFKKENEYLVEQVKKMQEQSSLKHFSSSSLVNDIKRKAQELEKENRYLANQVKKMQEEASIKSVFPAKENYISGSMGPVTIAGKNYDVWKKPVGKGASCVVYKAYDKARDSMVAIKVVSLQRLNPKSNDEMRREIELLNSLKDEDCIINLYDHEFKMEHCRLSMVLEYGEMDLHSYLQQTPCLVKSNSKQSYYEVCFLWQQMLRAVQCIHSYSIVHKDLKPQNFMKVKGKLKLIDFGISQMIQDEVTSMIIQQPEGTPNYIAPEMLSGTFGEADANVLGYRSDVYSLGCILYKMCFGVTPYQHVEKMQMKYFAIISKEEVPIPDSLRYSDIADTLVMSLRKDRTKRATVAQLLAL